MKIEYFHASKYGNGAKVAEEFQDQMGARGVTVNVHHIRDARPTDLPAADLYLFSSPGRMGKPIGGMRRFLKKLTLPAGTKYAVLTTEAAPRPDKKTGKVPTEEEFAKRPRARPIINEILQGEGLVEVAEEKVLVTGTKGPLEEGWQKKVEDFADRIPSSPDRQARLCSGVSRPRSGTRTSGSGSTNGLRCSAD
jgi:flavodoxin